MSETSPEALLPCPFCGASRIVKGERYFAMCVDCGATGPERNADATVKKFTGDWNRRDLSKITELEKERDEYKAKADSIVELEELHLVDGAMELRLRESPAMAAWTAQCLATIVAVAPNYVECAFTKNGQAEVDGKPIRFAFTVQKLDGKSPHEMRQFVEKERDELKDKLQRYEKFIQFVAASSLVPEIKHLARGVLEK